MNSLLRRFFAFYCIAYCMSAQALELGQMIVFDPSTGSKTITYEKKDGYAVVEGDILLGRISEMNQESAIFRRKLGGSRWPHGLIPYIIDENLPSKNKAAILEAMNYWRKKSSIDFMEINAENHSSYPDFIIFLSAEGTTCSSFVGRKGGQQEINLSPRCTMMNTVHEIGHALGLWHEQSRSDRDNYIRIVWDNIEKEHSYNFDQHINDGVDYGEYDYQSIMHYGPFAFSKNGGATIVPIQDGVAIGQREQLSEKDIAAITAMYPEF